MGIRADGEEGKRRKTAISIAGHRFNLDIPLVIVMTYDSQTSVQCLCPHMRDEDCMYVSHSCEQSDHPINTSVHVLVPQQASQIAFVICDSLSESLMVYRGLHSSCYGGEYPSIMHCRSWELLDARRVEQNGQSSGYSFHVTARRVISCRKEKESDSDWGRDLINYTSSKASQNSPYPHLLRECSIIVLR
jgi:hypothetical protein